MPKYGLVRVEKGGKKAEVLAQSTSLTALRKKGQEYKEKHPKANIAIVRVPFMKPSLVEHI